MLKIDKNVSVEMEKLNYSNVDKELVTPLYEDEIHWWLYATIDEIIDNVRYE